MTILVLLVLAVVWALVLVPPFLHRQAEGRLGDSIGAFRHQLRVLQRAGPTTVRPAHRLVFDPAAPAPFGSSSVGSGSAADGAIANGSTRTSGAVSPVALSARRHRTLKRRRDTLAVLAAGTSGALVLGFIPGLRVLLGLAVVFGLLLATYVALLVRMRNAAAEREMKLRFLPGPAVAEPALLLRRSAN